MTRYLLELAKGCNQTPRADNLINTVRNALESFRQLSESEPVFNPSTAERKFRICMTDASHITLLPQLLSQVRLLAPECSTRCLHALIQKCQLPFKLEMLTLGLVCSTTGSRLLSGDIIYPGLGLFDQQDHSSELAKSITLKQYKEEAHVLIAAQALGPFYKVRPLKDSASIVGCC
jgi:hypothetical protein